MLTSLKNITERAQKCDFLMEQTGFRFDILCHFFALNIALKKTFQL